jgi:pimeloyl-ACP methyl ester carboxylesterase
VASLGFSYTAAQSIISSNRPAMDLDTHITDVQDALEFDVVREIVPVGHRYGGMVIAVMADRMAVRLAAVVYLGTFLPPPGPSLHYLCGVAAAAERRGLAEEGNGLEVPPIARFRLDDSTDLAWASPRFTGNRRLRPRNSSTPPLRSNCDGTVGLPPERPRGVPDGRRAPARRRQMENGSISNRPRHPRVGMAS